MTPESESNLRLKIGHVLFIDIVGYSKLLIEEQKERLRQLTEIVLATTQVAEASNEQVVRLPTGDGMALVFRNSAEEPTQCALEITEALQKDVSSQEKPQLRLRMGIHSGPVSEVTDVSGRTNITGGGINMAQRVMDCGDAGHILLSKHVADDLQEHRQWSSRLHNLGECEVKHGVRVWVVNLYTDDLGNPATPHKVAASQAADAREKRAALQWISLGTLALFAAVVAIGFLVFRQRSTPLAQGLVISAKSVAVLPLENLTEEKENAYFADGIQDELLSNLAKIKDLKVISRTSVMQYKAGITRNLREIAQQLGVSNVIEGSVRRTGNHIRVSVQLIDALSDRHIWVQNYDRTLADSLALQGELATEIAAGVGATLSPQEKARVEATPTKNTAAYDAYLRGLAFASGVQWERSNVEGAIRSFQEAVKLDPNFTLAWTRLSHKQCDMYWIGLDPRPVRLAMAKDALDHALALDPNLPETHLALGYYRYYGQRDFTGALAEFKQAEQGLPNSVDVTRAIGLLQRRLGHWEEAIAGLRRAVELDPRNLDISIGLATTYNAVRRFPEALAIADRVLAFEPTNNPALWMKVNAFWATGNLTAAEPLLANPGTDPLMRGGQALLQRRYTAAIEIFSKALPNAPLEQRKLLLLVLGLSQQRAGDAAGARATYQQMAQDGQRVLEKAGPDSYPGAEFHSFLGIAYAGLGDAASAIAEGEKGMALQPSSKDPFEGPSREEATANIYALLGDADHAIPILERLLQTSYSNAITRALLRIDPIWDPIRSDPRFQEMVAEKKP